MLSKCATVIVWLLTSFALVNPADMDCSKRLDYNTVGNCCARPNFDFDAFLPSCRRYMQEGTPRMSPCFHECMFNSSNVMNGLELNVDNARKMLQDLIGTNKEFVEVYVRSMQNCTANMEKLMKRVKRRMYGREKCSMLPVFLGMCTIENSFVHCPSTSWRSSKQCEESRDFMLTCKCDKNQSVCIQL